jgi:hypothetical protein
MSIIPVFLLLVIQEFSFSSGNLIATDARAFECAKFEAGFESKGLSPRRNGSVVPRVDIECRRVASFDRVLLYVILSLPIPSPNSAAFCGTAYPAGDGSVAILRSMLSKSQRVRRLSARSNQ